MIATTTIGGPARLILAITFAPVVWMTNLLTTKESILPRGGRIARAHGFRNLARAIQSWPVLSIPYPVFPVRYPNLPT
jgi:hypothetical protein